jgi:hypothetical protein
LDYLTERMRSGLCDGFFLDVLGGRPWGEAKWETWPQWEKDEWSQGVTAFIRELDRRRREINPKFLLVNNNTWQYNEKCTQYVDGICIENIKPSNTYTVNWASKEFNDLGQRRVLVLARPGDTAFWQTVPGVTHIGEAPNGYGQVHPPTVGYEDLSPSPCKECEDQLKGLQEENARLQEDISGLSADNERLRSNLTQIHNLSAP